MPLGEATKKLLKILQARKLKPLAEITIQEHREQVDAVIPMTGIKREVAAIDTKKIPGRHGEIPIRIYTPLQLKTRGATIFFNGSGFVYGSLDTHEVICRDIANASGTKVIAVAYRSAPEFKYPIGLNDAFDATKWVIDHATEINVDRDKIGLAGESSGANFVALTAIHAREKQWPIAFQVLVVPAVDLSCSLPSYSQYKSGYLLDEERIKWYFNQYLSAKDDPKDPKISPLFTKDLSRLPPALILTAEYDPVKSDGEYYAKHLQEAGVSVQYSCYLGQLHSMLFYRGMIIGEKDPVVEIAEFIYRQIK